MQKLEANLNKTIYDNQMFRFAIPLEYIYTQTKRELWYKILDVSVTGNVRWNEPQ